MGSAFRATRSGSTSALGKGTAKTAATRVKRTATWKRIVMEVEFGKWVFVRTRKFFVFEAGVVCRRACSCLTIELWEMRGLYIDDGREQKKCDGVGICGHVDLPSLESLFDHCKWSKRDSGNAERVEGVLVFSHVQ